MKFRRRLMVLSALGAIFALSACSSLPSWLGGGAKETSKVEGDRIPVLRAATALSPDASLAGQPANIPPAEANADWPQHGGSARAAIGHVALPPTLSRHESAGIGGGAGFRHFLVPTPVVSGGLVFAMDAEGEVSAHKAGTLEKAWAVKGVATEDGDAVMGGGLAAEGGVVYAASGRGLVAALDAATGRELWRQAIGIPIRSAPRAEGGNLYVVTVDSQLFALDARSGSLLWSHRGVSEGLGFLIEASPAAVGDWVVAPYTSGEVHGLRADTGESAWSDVVAGREPQSAAAIFTGIGGDPVVADGVVYVAGSTGMFSAFALETGQRLWEQPVSSVNTPYLAGDSLYILTSAAELISLSRLDGRVRWIAKLPAQEDESDPKTRYSWNGPILAGGRVLVVGAHGEMRAFSPENGAELPQTEIAEGVYTAPVVAGGVLYLVDDDAKLHSYY